MYTALLLGSGVLAWSVNPRPGWLTRSARPMVLLLKSALQEQWLREKSAG